MHTLSERAMILREEAVNTKPHKKAISGMWWYYTCKGVVDVPEEQCNNAVLVASGIAACVTESPAWIFDRELLVGYNFGDGGYEWFTGDPKIDGDLLREGGFSEEQIAWFLENRGAGAARMKTVDVVGDITDAYNEMEREWTAIAPSTSCPI